MEGILLLLLVLMPVREARQPLGGYHKVVVREAQYLELGKKEYIGQIRAKHFGGDFILWEIKPDGLIQVWWYYNRSPFPEWYGEYRVINGKMVGRYINAGSREFTPDGMWEWQAK